MTHQTAIATEMKSPLDAAQKIVAELHGMNLEDQALAMQFAMQTLRLSPPTPQFAPSSAPARPDTPQAPPAAGTSERPTDIKSFTAARAPKSDQQFTAVVAYFYQFEAKQSERTETIDADVMKEAARLAGWPQVKRWALTLNNAKNAGYLDSAGEGKFKLSSVGENLVAITLPGNGATSGGNGGSTSRKSAKKKAAVKKTTKKGG